MSINISIVKGKKEFEKYDQEIQYAMSVITKFRDVSIIENLSILQNFFITELMIPNKPGFLHEAQ